MARERAKLSDKQEKILMQAMLMGLDARDMQQIGNRLMALKREAEEKASIADNIAGYSWKQVDHPTKKNPLGKAWHITDSDGYIYEFSNKTQSRHSSWYSKNFEYDIRVSKPGTRFKTRVAKGKNVSIDNDWKKKFMPEQSKELYGMIRYVGKVNWKYENDWTEETV